MASLFSLGFVAGALATPITGPLIDKVGRRRSALLYCALEIGINLLEQYPYVITLVICRMVGGITTNLLSSVFDAWLDTEYRLQGLDKDGYELILRDAVIVSNLAAIASGCLAHFLAECIGLVGPFQGAVSCTCLAFVVIWMLWSENFGSSVTDHNQQDFLSMEVPHLNNEGKDDTTLTMQQQMHGSRTLRNSDSTTHLLVEKRRMSIVAYLLKAAQTFRSDTRVLRVGIIQGLTGGSIQIFIFLWSPTLQSFASSATSSMSSCWFDSAKEPAYGLIFGAFMGCGVLGGLCSSFLRKYCSKILAPIVSIPRSDNECHNKECHRIHLPKRTKPMCIGSFEVRSSGGCDTSGENCREALEVDFGDQPVAAEFLAFCCYLLSTFLLAIPCVVDSESPLAFGISLLAFLALEFLIGVAMPCEGVIRSLYMPADDRATMMAFPRMVVNLAVSLGVMLTTYFS